MTLGRLHTPEPLVPEHSAFEVEMTIENLKRYKSGIYEIPAELIQSGDRIICTDIGKFINLIWSKEKLPQQQKKSVIVHFYKKGDRTDCFNYQDISLLSALYKVLSNILMSRLTPSVYRINGDHCGF